MAQKQLLRVHGLASVSLVSNTQAPFAACLSVRAGIWDEAIKLPPKPKIREHVKAGKRSAPYLSDMFTYGQAGIFGARRETGQSAPLRVSRVFKGAMLHGGKDRQARIKSSIPQVWGLPPQVRQSWRAGPLACSGSTDWCT